MKYRYYVYQDIKDFYKENYGEEITDEAIDKLDNEEVLRCWLEWNGIIGYTSDIISIMEAKQDGDY